jgi:hypothetical protein
MQYQQPTEKATKGNDNSIPDEPLTLDDVPGFRRTRLIVLFLNGICFVSFCISFE